MSASLTHKNSQRLAKKLMACISYDAKNFKIFGVEYPVCVISMAVDKDTYLF